MARQKKKTQAAQHLQTVDPVLGVVIEKIALEKRKPRTNYFQSLVEEIISQQLSGRVADVITERFVALFPTRQADSTSFPDPDAILARSDEELRKARLSYQKISYIKNVSHAVIAGELDFKKFSAYTDEEVIALLTQIKGIGRWTAEMFLMFTLGREDVFSHGDLGLKNAIQRLYSFRKHPSRKTMEHISRKWSPHRTLARRYLWASLKSE